MKKLDTIKNRMNSIRNKYGLNEALSNVKDEAQEVVNPVFADAIRGIKRANKMRDEAQEVKPTPKTETPEVEKRDVYKKMYLSESLFEHWDDEDSEDDFEDISLPTDIVISADEIDLTNLDNLTKEQIKQIEEDLISDYLSDTYGYTHFGFNYAFNEKDNTYHIYNIMWDIEEFNDFD